MEKISVKDNKVILTVTHEKETSLYQKIKKEKTEFILIKDIDNNENITPIPIK